MGFAKTKGLRTSNTNNNPRCSVNGCFVFVSEASFYQPGKEFTCLTSGEVVPWEFVNDDYCDCKDGTDEPGALNNTLID